MPAIPAIPSSTTSASNIPSPAYLCYFNQTQGLVSATNCSLAPSPTDEPQPAWLTALIIFSDAIYILCFALFFYFILNFIRERKWLPDLPRWAEIGVRRIFFWRSAPKPELVPEPIPEPELEPPDPGTQAYFNQIKKSCTPDELLLWNQITLPGKYNTTASSTDADCPFARGNHLWI